MGKYTYKHINVNTHSERLRLQRELELGQITLLAEHADLWTGPAAVPLEP